MRVVVVGAGLGGLCVANGLHKAGVDVEVFEARDGIHDAGQGYRININATGHNALRACLADRAFPGIRAHAAPPGRSGGVPVFACAAVALP